MRRSLMLILGASLLLSVSACICWPTRVTEAPLPPEEEEELRQTLIGVWYADAFENRRGTIDYNEPHHFIYHFNEDGTGRYDQNYVVQGQNDFQWELKGRNLHVVMDRGGTESVWRIDDYSETDMRWFNYFDSGYFLMKRQK